ncbi:MAG TPA: helix-turn-helix domain-containing protein [Methylomirabilota bacterium]
MQEIITPSQVADLLQVHVKTVYRLAERGVIPGNKIGRRWRFSRQRILDLVADHGSGPDGSTPRHLRSTPPSPRS